MALTQLYNPATAAPLAQIPQTSAQETAAHIEAAHRAFPAWRDSDPGYKAGILNRFAQLVEQNKQDLAALEVKNSGHPISNALWEAGNAAEVLGYYAGAPHRLLGQQIPVSGGINVTYREAMGVVGVIVPWNFPLPIAAWGLAPALAAGNTVIVKPAELTPLTAIRLAELAKEAGLPDGVLTVLPGKGSMVGQTLLEHPLVRKIVFTGSTQVGKKVLGSCAQQVKRVTLELGGKNSNIIFADADLEKAAAAAPAGVFDNAGQDCCSRSRLLVQRSVYEKFMSYFERAVQDFRVENPWLETSQMGPLISADHAQKVQAYIEAGRVAFTGSCPQGPGNWVAPTVLIPDSQEAADFKEEIFGPVVSVLAFDDEQQAIELANNTDYGLSGSIWTSSLDRAVRVSRAVQSGNLSVNSHSSVRFWTPFGGFKQSGLGRELGPDALEAFTETKNVFYAVNEWRG